MAAATWELLFKGKWKDIDQFVEFVKTENQKPVPKDTWNQVLSFVNEIDTNYNKVSEMINFDNKLKITKIADLVNDLGFYDYGPILTMLDLDILCENIQNKISALREDDHTIFYHLFKILLSKENNLIENSSIMILKKPYCLFIKFGIVENVDYVINLDNLMAIYLSDSRTSIFNETYYQPAREYYKKTIEEMKQLSVISLTDDYHKLSNNIEKQKKRNYMIVWQNLWMIFKNQE